MLGLFSRKISFILGVSALTSACPYGVAYPTAVYGFATDCEQGSYGVFTHDTHPNLAHQPQWGVELHTSSTDENDPKISEETAPKTLHGALPVVDVGRFKCDLQSTKGSYWSVREAICTSNKSVASSEMVTCRMRLNMLGFRPSKLDIGTPCEDDGISPMGIDEVKGIAPQELFARPLDEMNSSDEHNPPKHLRTTQDE